MIIYIVPEVKYVESGLNYNQKMDVESIFFSNKDGLTIRNMAKKSLHLKNCYMFLDDTGTFIICNDYNFRKLIDFSK